jgi:hypothetical protein
MLGLTRTEKANLIIQHLCKRSVYTQASGMANNVRLDLAKGKLSLINNLYTLVVLGEKGGDKQEA